MCQRERDLIATVARAVVSVMLFAPALVWAASEGGHEGGGLISLDKSLIVQGINFVILLFILQRLLYRPFLAKMAERTQAIQKSLDEAQAAPRRRRSSGSRGSAIRRTPSGASSTASSSCSRVTRRSTRSSPARGSRRR